MLSIGLTSLTIICVARQFIGKKGTYPHIISGIVIGPLIWAVILINTATTPINEALFWSPSFLIHTLLGLLSVVFWTMTAITGISLLITKNSEIKLFHKKCALITALCLFLSIIAGIPLIGRLLEGV